MKLSYFLKKFFYPFALIFGYIRKCLRNLIQKKETIESTIINNSFEHVAVNLYSSEKNSNPNNIEEVKHVHKDKNIDTISSKKTNLTIIYLCKAEILVIIEKSSSCFFPNKNKTKNKLKVGELFASLSPKIIDKDNKNVKKICDNLIKIFELSIEKGINAFEIFLGNSNTDIDRNPQFTK